MCGLWDNFQVGNVLVVDSVHCIKEEIVERGVGGVVTETKYAKGNGDRYHHCFRFAPVPRDSVNPLLHLEYVEPN